MSEEMKRCPFCGEEILALAKKCKHCESFVDENLLAVKQGEVAGNRKKFYKIRKVGKFQIGGVCAGLGEYFDKDPLLFRLAFIAFFVLTGGTGIIVYTILLFLLPTKKV